MRRLEEAIQEESNRQSTSSNGNNRKRQRDGSENEDTEKNKVKVTEELRSMTVKQLREEASRRGISTSGSKKELVERLSSFSDDGSDNGKLPDVVEGILFHLITSTNICQEKVDVHVPFK